MTAPARLGLAGAWGILGVVAVLAQAIRRLLPRALEIGDYPLGVLEYVALIAWVVMNAYAEGYKGFHKQFAPRTVARAQHLAANRRPLFVALAPLYCMGLFHATKKRLITAWILVLAIAALVLFVRHLPQPWRGIIDAGVVLGLAIGTLSIAYFTARAIAGAAMPVEPDVPARTS